MIAAEWHVALPYDPDILATGLKAVFCGMNPAISADTSGHSFSAPSNRFWKVLYLAGFTDVQLEPKEAYRLLAYRFGITAVVTRPTRRGIEVSTGEFRTARPHFEERIRGFAPRSIAFLGKRALSAMLRRHDLDWGRQPRSIGDVPTWVLPNPSGLNRGFSLDALVSIYTAFRVEIDDMR